MLQRRGGWLCCGDFDLGRERSIDSGVFWRKSVPEARACWNWRAEFLNSLTPVGVFVEAPASIKDFMSSALRSVTAKLADLKKSFWSSHNLLNEPKGVFEK